MFLGNQKEDKESFHRQITVSKKLIKVSSPINGGKVKGGEKVNKQEGQKEWLRRSVEGNEAAYFSFPCYMYPCHFEQLGDKCKFQ